MSQKALNERIKVEKLLDRYKDRDAVAVVDDKQRILYTRAEGKQSIDDNTTLEKVKKMTSIRQMLTPTTGVIVVSSTWKK